MLTSAISSKFISRDTIYAYPLHVASFLQRVLPKCAMHFASAPCVQYALPISSFLFDHANNIWWRYVGSGKSDTVTGTSAGWRRRFVSGDLIKKMRCFGSSRCILTVIAVCTCDWWGMGTAQLKGNLKLAKFQNCAFFKLRNWSNKFFETWT